MTIEGRGEGLKLQSMAAERAFGGGWKKKVETRAVVVERIFNGIDDPVKKRETGNLIKGATDSAFGSAEDLVLAVEKNPQDRNLRESEALVVQSVALAMIEKGGAMKEAIESGDVDKVEASLPSQLKPLARGVAEVVTPSVDILARVQELNEAIRDEMLDEVPDAKRESELIDTATRGIRELVKSKGYGDESLERGAVLRVLRTLNFRKEFLNKEKKEFVKEEKTKVRPVTEEDSVPENVEDRIQLARKLLDWLEYKKIDPWSIEASYDKQMLEAIRKVCEKDGKAPDLVAEINARLHIQLIKGAMAGAGGWIDIKTDMPISRALKRADDEGGLFTIDDLQWCFRGGSGLSKALAYAWNMYQQMNVVGKGEVSDRGRYHDVFREIKADRKFRRAHGLNREKMDRILSAGTRKGELVDKEKMWSETYDNYAFDSNQDRRAIVDAFIAHKALSEMAGEVDEYEVKKGTELAWAMMIASGEVSMFNYDFAGHDDLMELTSTKLDTLDRMKKGKTIGAFCCLERVVSLSPSWLRYMSDRTIFGVLRAEDIKIDRMREIGKYTIDYWYSSIITQKIFELKKVMRSEGAKPDELKKLAVLKGIGEWVSKVSKYPAIILNKEGKAIISSDGGDIVEDGRPVVVTESAKKQREKRLRYLLVAGWAELAVSDIDLGWTQGDWRAFCDTLTRDYITDEDGNTSTFISKAEMAEINGIIMAPFMNGFVNLEKLERLREAKEKGRFSILKPTKINFHL